MGNQLANLLLLVAILLPTSARPSTKSTLPPDEQALASLEKRASEASNRDQCYLYAELVHETVRYSANEYATGDVDKATTKLKQTQRFTLRLRTLLGTDAKDLKRAQILLRRAAYRLADLLHMTSSEDRALVKETLAEVEKAQRDMLRQVFRK